MLLKEGRKSAVTKGGNYFLSVKMVYEVNGWLYKEEKGGLDSFNLSLKEFSFFLPMSESNCQRPVR